MPTDIEMKKDIKKTQKQPEQKVLFDSNSAELRPKITVFGIGGAGGNAVNNMIRSKLEGVEFVVANTDSQSLSNSLAETKIQLGLNMTQGLGAGSRPDVGKASAEEAENDIMDCLNGSNMVFITAGMGGGTGTGAGPVIARMAKDQGILTIGVVTQPFHFEGIHRMRTAEKGIDELQQFVDTLLIIPNQNLFRVANDRTTFADAFKMADDVLYSGVRGVTDLMVMPGLINLDFADIRTVMSEMGKAMMGTGDAEGERRALDAAEAAISNPLLDDVSMKGARGVLINITGGYDMTLYEVDEAANRIREEVDSEANIIFGSTFDEAMHGSMRVSVVATGIDVDDMHSHKRILQARSNADNASFTDSSGTDDEPVKNDDDVKAIDSQIKQFDRQVEDYSDSDRHNEEIETGHHKSFLERLGFGRNKKTSKVTTPTKSSNDKPEPINQGVAKPFGDEVDEVDIPAFLRRK